MKILQKILMKLENIFTNDFPKSTKNISRAFMWGDEV